MITKQPGYRYVVAVILGFIIIFTPEMQPSPIPLALISLFLGCFLGFIWPAKSWRWGLWIAGPTFVLVGLSVAFAGQVEIFLEKDLPLILLVLASACIGSFAGAWVRQKRTTQ